MYLKTACNPLVYVTASIPQPCVLSRFEEMEKEGYGEMTQTAVFAGCFWGVEAAFGQLEGVLKTSSGFTGGR